MAVALVVVKFKGYHNRIMVSRLDALNRKFGVGGAGLNLEITATNIYGRACLGRGCIRVAERASLIEVEPAARSETSTRWVIRQANNTRQSIGSWLMSGLQPRFVGEVRG